MKKSKKIACTVLALMMVASSGMSVFAATEHWNDAANNTSENAEWTAWKTAWETVKTDYQKVAITVGADETQINFSWYSKTQETPAVRLANNIRMNDYTEFSGTQDAAPKYISADGVQTTEGNGDAYYASKVTVTGLEENTTYYYQYYQNGEWSDATEFTTQDFDSFKALLYGDPQIGACSGQTSVDGSAMSGQLAARNDAFNWNLTVEESLEKNPDTNFLITAGDQVNTSRNEYEYAGFLNAGALDNYALSTAIGNHDSSNSNYSDHYNNPNSGVATEGQTAAGTDYYYTYGNTLFIILDTNNYNCATHEAVMKEAVAKNPDAKWRVVMFHQDIYGSGKDHSASDGMVLRTQLTPLMDEYDIDVVLQGHDHTYSRTYQLSSDGQEHKEYNNSNWRGDEDYLSENECYNILSSQRSGTVIDPEGTVYLETNSASGSKFYELIANQQDYVAERSQTWTPSYSVLTIDENSFSIATYDVTTGEMLADSTPYTIVKSADKTALNEAIADAEAIDGSKYTAESYAALTEALKAAKAVAADAEATDSEVAQAVADLANAKAGLAVIVVDKTALNEAIAAAEAVDGSKYTEESYAALTKALEAAKAVAADADATEEEVAQAAEALTAAQKALVEVSNENPNEKPDDNQKPDDTQKPSGDNNGNTSEDPNKGPMDNPSTGDNGVAAWALTAALSGMGIAGIVISEKRKKANAR